MRGSTSPCAGPFLRFQAIYYQHSVSSDAERQRPHQELVRDLYLREQYAAVESELDRQEQAAERDSADKMEWLLFLVGLGGSSGGRGRRIGRPHRIRMESVPGLVDTG